MIITKPFQEQVFYLCYDCGWGERGVSEYHISFQRAFDIIEKQSGKEIAESFAKDEDHCFEFSVDRYMVSEHRFIEEEWEGSDDC